MKEKLTDMELEAVHLRGRVAELERIVKAQKGELAELRARCSSEIPEEELRVLQMWPRFEDGAPVEVGDDALDKNGVAFTVGRIEIKERAWMLNDSVSEGHYLNGGWAKRVKRPAPEVIHPMAYLTHRAPDSWEKLGKDATKSVSDYWKCYGEPCHRCPSKIDGKMPYEYYNTDASCVDAKELDVIRRAKKLAGVAE